MMMVSHTLESFNGFLTERLTAVAMDIYGFFEKVMVENQEEVYRTQQENLRLQRLLDLVYKPEIRLHRTDAKPPCAPMFKREIPTQQEVSVSQEEPEHLEAKEEQSEELCDNSIDEQVLTENSDDSLTKELVKTVQQLEDGRKAEECKEPQQTPSNEPDLSEGKTSTTLYRCHICNYIFTKKTVLTWHLKMHESKSNGGKRNFGCHICGKVIPRLSNLQSHMRVHTGERPYSCKFCDKCFKLKGHMTEHLRTHTGEKPFTCHVCNKSFNRGFTMRKHVLAKHQEERPYKCDYCCELFTEKLLMRKHVKKVHGV
ncbi:zinc finger protein 679 [Nothobranchius furzeri]|nr:zinc finger protein 37 [Nothobranchius furzeri]